MKKSFVMIPAVLAAATLSVGGCSSNAATNSPQSSTPQTNAVSDTAKPFPVTLKDDSGHSVTISKQPVRIASITEGTDEILTALVPKSHMVLVTNFANDPNYSNVASLVKGIPTIQTASSEQIIAAQPDLVLMASYTKSGVVSQIQQAKIPAYEFNDFTSIAEIERNIEVVGKLVGNDTAAKNLVQKMESDLEAVDHAVKAQKKVTVLDYSSYGFAAGASTTVNDVIVHAGGINAAASLNGWQKITDEEVVKMNPDVIIDADDDKGFVQKVLSDPALKNVSAVKNHRVYSVKGADLSSVSQYVTQGVVDVAKLLYPTVQISQ